MARQDGSPISYGSASIQEIGYGLGAEAWEPLSDGGVRFWTGSGYEDRTKADLEAVSANGPYCGTCRQHHAGKCYGR